MTDKILALFPGQGSQKVGMGSALCEHSERARELFARADSALGFSLSTVCMQGPLEKLTATSIAQPAILTVSTICFTIFQDYLEKSCADGSSAAVQVVAAAGHSLGEYSALVAANALFFEDAVTLVHKRGTYMQEAVPVGQGRMVAILGKEVSDIDTACQSVSETLPGNEVVQVANINAPGQVVIAGSQTAVEHCLKALEPVKSVELSVSAPFHCRLMKPAEEQLARDLATLSIQACRFPVYSNYSALPLREPDDIREALRLQVCSRVRWVECMQNAITDTSPDRSVEFGFGNVLSGLLKRINTQVPRANMDSVESLASFTSI